MGKSQCGICHFSSRLGGLLPPYLKESESEVLGILTAFDTINPLLDQDLGRVASSKIKDRASFLNTASKPLLFGTLKLLFHICTMVLLIH